jgi:hypothetical protein
MATGQMADGKPAHFSDLPLAICPVDCILELLLAESGPTRRWAVGVARGAVARQLDVQPTTPTARWLPALRRARRAQCTGTNARLEQKHRKHIVRVCNCVHRSGARPRHTATCSGTVGVSSRTARSPQNPRLRSDEEIARSGGGTSRSRASGRPGRWALRRGQTHRATRPS